MKFSQVFLDQAASEVAERFLKKGEAPTDVVMDIALRNSLNVEQIRRVCEAGNIAIKTGSADANIVFPLAKYEEIVDTLQPVAEGPSATEVVEVSKTASLQDDLPSLLDEDEMNKIAEYKTARNRNYAAANMYYGLENAMRDTRREMASIAEEVEKQAALIIESAVSDMIKHGSANQSFSVLSNLCHNEAETGLLTQLFKIAARQFERDYGSEVPLDPQLEKVAGVPNPASPLFAAVAGYLDNMGKYAIKRASLAKYEEHHERFRAQLYGAEIGTDDNPDSRNG